ncbi:HAMP domain-containing histidine kinase [Myxococcota bacterium]|nr:HAMP domain-containing histidine kinase [Myxococcota bacterium]
MIRQTVVESVEKCVSAEAGRPDLGYPLLRPQPDALRKHLVSQWLLGPDARRFVEILWGRLLDAAARPLDELRRQLLDGLRRVVESRSDEGGSIASLELAAHAHAAAQALARPSLDPVYYAHCLQLLRHGLVTPLGRVFGRLDGRDAVRWLLTVEVLQSAGPGDDRRLSGETARYLLENPDELVNSEYWEPHQRDAVQFPHSWETLARLEALDVLWIDPDPAVTRYRLREQGAVLLREASSADSPLRAVAGALVERESGARISGEGWSAATDHRAAEWVVETMAHGLRNALGPTSFALEALAESGSLDPQSSEVLERIRVGVNRAFKLVTDLVDLYRTAEAPAEVLELAPAVRDAVANANGGGVTVALDQLEGCRIRGRRLRLVHGLVELIRNARQHPRGDAPVEVAITGRVEGSEAVIQVDDDGTGVAPELRSRIFERGFTTRPDGSGQGLALLREVVVRELGGKVEVDESAAGGASFRVSLPLARGT